MILINDENNSGVEITIDADRRLSGIFFVSLISSFL
jgi:hypothetical protein